MDGVLSGSDASRSVKRLLLPPALALAILPHVFPLVRLSALPMALVGEAFLVGIIRGAAPGAHTLLAVALPAIGRALVAVEVLKRLRPLLGGQVGFGQTFIS